MDNYLLRNFFEAYTKTIRARWILLIICLIALTLITNCKRKDTKNKFQSEIEGIHAAFYNSKGGRIAASTSKGNLLLLDTQLHIIKVVNTHQGNTTSSFFSLDDNKIITGGKDKSICLWSSQDLMNKGRYLFNFYPYTTIAGYRTFGGCGENGSFLMYNVATKDTFSLVLEEAGAYHLYFCFSDSIVVVGSGKKGFQIDIVNKKILNEYVSHAGEVYCIMPSNSNNYVVSCATDSTIKIFNRNTSELLHTSPKLDGEVYVCCFSNDDTTIAASTSTGYLYIYDSTLTKEIKKIKAFNTVINCFHYSPDGSRMIVVSEGGGMKIFSTQTWQVLYELKADDY